MKFKEASETIVEQFKKDKKDKSKNTVYHSYQANIAMSFVDAHANWKRKHDGKIPNNKEIHEIANNAATNFLELFIGDKN